MPRVQEHLMEQFSWAGTSFSKGHSQFAKKMHQITLLPIYMNIDISWHSITVIPNVKVCWLISSKTSVRHELTVDLMRRVQD